MDVAALSLSIDSSSVVKATNDLNAFSDASDRARRAAGGNSPTGNAAKIAQDYARAAEKAGQYSNAAMRAVAANDNVERAARAASIANDNLAASAVNAGKAFAAADAHVLAYRTHLARTGEGARAAGAAIQFTAREGLNASRQLADIGTTLAMGMNPFLIAIQQGPQLFDILQEKALETGTSISAVFKAAGVAIWTALAPILPAIAAIAAVTGVLAGGFALATREINRGADSAVERLGLTEKQLERVKKAGVDTGVTLSDTFFGFFDVVGDRLMAAFDGPLKWLSKAWSSTLDFITKNVGQGIKAIVGGFTGAFYAIKAVWGLLPGAIADLTVQAANWALRSLQNMINGSIDMINRLISYLPDWLKGGAGGGTIAHVNLGQIDNGFAGQAARAGQAAGAAFADGFSDGSGAVGRFFDDWSKAASARRDARIMDAAGKAEAAASAAKPREKAKERDPWADLLANADRQQRALDQAGAQIGVYGEELAWLKAQQDLFNQAQDAGIKLTDAQTLELQRRAAALGAKDYDNTRKAAAEATAVAHAEAMRQLEVERGALGLTGEALASYRYQQELINRELAAGVKLKDIDMGKVREQGDAYGEAVTAIERQRQAIADAREVAAGFFSDWFGAVRQGENVFKAFGNAVVNSLNRIIDKLIEAAIQQAILAAIPGGGGGGGGSSLSFLSFLGFADGGAFGTAQKFAKGGAFSNQVVNTPTLFRFANGAKLGEMGEAGPEAIMPLSRDSSGRLGVKTTGGGRPQIRMGDIHVHNSLAGAIGPEGLATALQASGERTVEQIRRELQAMLQRWDEDGTMV